MTNYVTKEKRVSLKGYGRSGSLIVKTKNPLGIEALAASVCGDDLVIATVEKEDDLKHLHYTTEYLGDDHWTEYTAFEIKIVHVNRPLDGVQLRAYHEHYGSGGGDIYHVSAPIADPSIPPFPGFVASYPWETSIPAHNGKIRSYDKLIMLDYNENPLYLVVCATPYPIVYDPFPEEDPPEEPPVDPEEPEGSGLGGGGGAIGGPGQTAGPVVGGP